MRNVFFFSNLFLGWVSLLSLCLALGMQGRLIELICFLRSDCANEAKIFLAVETWKNICPPLPYYVRTRYWTTESRSENSECFGHLCIKVSEHCLIETSWPAGEKGETRHARKLRTKKKKPGIASVVSMIVDPPPTEPWAPEDPEDQAQLPYPLRSREIRRDQPLE